MRPSDTVPAVVLMLALGGCATKSDLDYLNYQVEELNVRASKSRERLGNA